MHLRRLRSIRRARLVLALSAAGLLAACENSNEEFDWTAPRVAAEPEVQVTEFRYEVSFVPGRDVLAPAAQDQLRRFMTNAGADPRDRVYVLAVAPASGVTAEEALVAQRQRAGVMAALARWGIASAPRYIPAGAADAPRSGVAVLVERTELTLPACPDWTSEPGDNADNRPMSNWSCATAVNFGLMVADPNDLARGRTPGAADGEYLARSVENYRKGKVRDLIRDASSSDIYPAMAPSGSSNGTN